MPKVRVFLEVEIKARQLPDELTELTELISVNLAETAPTAGRLRRYTPTIVSRRVIHAEHADPPLPRRKSPKGLDGYKGKG